MSNIFGEDRETQIVGGGYGRGYGYGDGGGNGIGGIGAIVLLIIAIAVLWFLAGGNRKDGHYDGGCAVPYPPYPYPPYPPYGGSNCGNPLDCKIPMAIDMSNCEVDKDIWKLDAHMERCCCEEKEVTHCEGEKTRALINDLNVQNLRDKLAEANAEKASLESKFYTEKKFGDLEALLCKYDQGNDKQYYKLDNKIDALFCEIPKRPPIFVKGSTVDTHDIDCHDFPRRRGCDFDKDCCC